MRLKTAVPMMLLLLLCACGAAEATAQTPVRFRTALNQAGGCSFTTELTADYGDYTRKFTLACRGDAAAGTSLTVLEPEAARGVSAVVRGEDAQVSYEDTVLAVEDFDSRRISPMAAPYLLVTAWSEGYIQSVGRDGQLEQVRYLLGYGGRQLEVVTEFDGATPCRGEITDGTNVLISCEIADFSLHNIKDDEHGQAAETDLGGG